MNWKGMIKLYLRLKGLDVDCPVLNISYFYSVRMPWFWRVLSVS